MLWELSALITVLLSAAGVWWFFTPQTNFQRAIVALASIAVFTFAPQSLLFQHYAPAYDSLLDFWLDALRAVHIKMVLTLGAVVWLLHRSWQTLWKPVPDLINVLGVDVPVAPDVSLAGIESQAVTLSWTTPPANRPVDRYKIQVNGIHVGDSAGHETAITVTGLKPSHFYNISVIAVGTNNFLAASKVIRLRTYDEAGKPQLGDSRMPPTFKHGQSTGGNDGSNPETTRRSGVPSVEAAAPVVDGKLTPNRDTTSSAPSQRRNTLNRKHSPSVASSDQPPLPTAYSSGPEASMDELNRKFESLRMETHEVAATYAREEADFKKQKSELEKEKERKQQLVKEKEQQTAQLKTQNRTIGEQMRAAQKELASKQKQLEQMEAKKGKSKDNITKFESEIERMKQERESYAAKRVELKEETDCKIAKCDEDNSELQDKVEELTAELDEKGKQLQELKADRQRLSGAEEEKTNETDAQIDHQWEARRTELHNQLVAETKRGHFLDQQSRVLSEQLSIQQQSGLAQYSQPDPGAPEFEPANGNHNKRLSHHSNTIPENMPFHQSPGPEMSPSGPSMLARHNLPQVFYTNNPADGGIENMTEAELRAASGPMSPSARTLLPSFLRTDDDHIDSKLDDDEADEPLPASITRDEEPQSPLSPARSPSVYASPRESSQHLPFSRFQDSEDGLSNIHSSPQAAPTPANRFSSFFSNFQRSKPQATDLGPAFGSLRPGQSQSFPRGTDESEMPRRRGSWIFSNLNRNSTALDGQSSTSRFLRHRFGAFSGDTAAERDAELARPASVTSSDLPRPSTDSSSIWGPMPGSRGPWSPGNENRWPSRAGSRRPSLQGQSILPTTTTLANADDDILDDAELLNHSSKIGVIGSRPPARSGPSAIGPPGLNAPTAAPFNPNAPTFMGNVSNIFRKDKDGANSESGSKKGKDKENKKDKKGKSKEVTTPSIELPSPKLDDSPVDSRMSRDTHSVHTMTSVTESHDSLPLENVISNSTTDNNPSASLGPQQENKVRKLFRKGSSGKFSLSGKGSGLFKKAPGSATNSEKNGEQHAGGRTSIGDLTAEEVGEGDEAMLGRSYDSVTSSPSLGPARTKDSSGREISGRMTSWRFGKKKRGVTPSKERESMEMDKAPDEE